MANSMSSKYAQLLSFIMFRYEVNYITSCNTRLENLGYSGLHRTTEVIPLETGINLLEEGGWVSKNLPKGRRPKGAAQGMRAEGHGYTEAPELINAVSGPNIKDTSLPTECSDISYPNKYTLHTGGCTL